MGVMDTVKGWFGTAKDTAADVTEKAKPHVESAVEKTKETASDLTEKAKPHVESAVEKTKDRLRPDREAKEKVSDMKSGAKEYCGTRQRRPSRKPSKKPPRRSTSSDGSCLETSRGPARVGDTRHQQPGPGDEGRRT